MDRNYTTSIKGVSILTVVWAHSGAKLSVGGIQFIAGIGVALFLMCSGYGLEISYKKNGLKGFWRKRLLGVCLPFWVVELAGLIATGTFSIKVYLLDFCFLKPATGYGWFMGYIVICYLIFYAVKKLVKDGRMQTLVLFGAFDIWFVLDSVFFANPNMPFLRARQMLSFPVGVLLAVNKDKIERALTKTKNILILMGGIVCLLFMAVTQLNVVKNLPYLVSNTMALLTCLTMTIGIMAFGKSFSRIFENELLAATGMISYEIYLVHTFTLGMIKPSIISVFIFAVVTYVLAYILHIGMRKVKMTDLTVVILTKNEEKNLRKCVESFRGVAKRFVIVDSFSTDGTEALCRELNSELQKIGSALDFYQHKWISYADQLNWGLQNTCIDTEWSMRMDADEEIMEDLATEIDEKLPNVKAPVNGIILRRRVYFMGRWIKHGGRYPELLLRIFRTGKASCEMKIMDEHMILSEGTTVEFKHDLIDNNQKDLEWWTAKHNWYSNREVLDHQMTLENEMDESLEQDGTSSGQAKMKRVVKNSGYYRLPKFFRAHLYFIYRYYIKLGFLDGPEGRIFHFLQAYWYRFLVDAKIYECEKKGTKMKPQGDLKA